jgi:NAD(P)-dependent dehydrogenase (short-subunit alcohol dehydrogenase family)
MSTVVITGSAGGIGTAIHVRLRDDGHRVIGVDVRDADVIADLSIVEGRNAMIADVSRLSGGVVDGVVAAAGVLQAPGELVASVNYFGAVATLEGLRPCLARGTNPSAVAISSTSTTTFPGVPMDLAEACLAGDEEEARKLASKDEDGALAYPATKLALARWVRRNAVTSAWIGSGINLNAIAPGYIQTPMTAGSESVILDLGDVFPMPIGRTGQPDEIAGLVAYLLSPEAALICGSVIFIDGGTDAALRPDDWPAPR